MNCTPPQFGHRLFPDPQYEKAGSLNEKQKTYVHIIFQSGRYLLNPINDILGLSRIDAEELELKPVNPNAVFTNAEQVIYPFASRKNLTVKINRDPALPPAYADEKKLKQNTNNLLSNAAKFTGNGSRISVDAVANGNMIRISDLSLCTAGTFGLPANRASAVYLLLPFRYVKKTDLLPASDGY
jgi:signal transduction histidine kinase